MPGRSIGGRSGRRWISRTGCQNGRESLRRSIDVLADSVASLLLRIERATRIVLFSHIFLTRSRQGRYRYTTSVPGLAVSAGVFLHENYGKSDDIAQLRSVSVEIFVSSCVLIEVRRFSSVSQ